MVSKLTAADRVHILFAERAQKPFEERAIIKPAPFHMAMRGWLFISIPVLLCKN